MKVFNLYFYLMDTKEIESSKKNESLEFLLSPSDEFLINFGTKIRLKEMSESNECFYWNGGNKHDKSIGNYAHCDAEEEIEDMLKMKFLPIMMDTVKKRKKKDTTPYVTIKGTKIQVKKAVFILLNKKIPDKSERIVNTCNEKMCINYKHLIAVQKQSSTRVATIDKSKTKANETKKLSYLTKEQIDEVYSYIKESKQIPEEVQKRLNLNRFKIYRIKTGRSYKKYLKTYDTENVG